MSKQLTLPGSDRAVNPEESERIDRFLLRNVGSKTTTEIAREMGLPPHEVKARITVLLDSVDILTIQQERVRLMVTLNELVQKGLDRLEDIGDGLSDREWAQISSSISSSVKISLGELARMEAKDDGKITELNALRVQGLIKLMQETVTEGSKEIAQTYGIDEFTILEIFNNALIQASFNLEKDNGLVE